MALSDVSEEFLFELEKKIIGRYKTFRGLQSLPIKIVNNQDFFGRNSTTEIQISTCFLDTKPSKKEIENLLKHELIHSVVPGGHNLEFLSKSKKLKIAGDYEHNKLIDEMNAFHLEGRLRYTVKDGMETYEIRRRPSWKGFEEYFSHYYINPGFELAALRELYGLTVDEVSNETGISSEQLLEVESSDIIFFYKDETLFKRIFKALLRLNSKRSSEKKKKYTRATHRPLS